nr:MAG TPA: hypothetical protein [Caudoviricetes sp.]
MSTFRPTAGAVRSWNCPGAPGCNTKARPRVDETRDRKT